MGEISLELELIGHYDICEHILLGWSQLKISKTDKDPTWENHNPFIIFFKENSYNLTQRNSAGRVSARLNHTSNPQYRVLESTKKTERNTKFFIDRRLFHFVVQLGG
jgi:hypothetical protein